MYKFVLFQTLIYIYNLYVPESDDLVVWLIRFCVRIFLDKSVLKSNQGILALE